MAATDILSDKAIRVALKAAAASGKARKISDGGGLVLEVRPTDAGWWRWRFWRDGKEGMLSLGTYPEVSLKAARERRDVARRQLAAGEDPSEARKAEKAERAAAVQAARLHAEGKPGPGTFEAVAREWLSTVHETKVSAGHAQRTRIRLEQDIFPWLGRRPIGEVTAPELLQCLRRVEARGAIETAHRIKDSCGQVFRFGVASGVCVRNPAADLRDALRPVPTRHHAAIIDPKRGGELLRDMMAYNGHPVTRAALGLSALLLLRPGELRHMEWAWVDLDEGTLVVPSEVMKRKKAEKANGDPPNIDAGEGVPMMFAEMAQAELYPPQYRQNTDAAVESVTVTLFNLKRPSAWDEVSEWIDREGAIANADVVRIAGVDTLKASKMLIGWREQGLLVALPGRAKRNMAYTKPSAADQPVSLLSPLEDNNSAGS